MEPVLSAIHVALLDDHPLFRQGLRYILESLPYVEKVTEAAEMNELLVVCRQRLPDVLLLDLQMPELDGAEVAQALLQEFPDLKIIVLSMFSADKYITQMMKLGARSYLPKDAGQTELIQAISEVLQSGYHFTPRMSRALTRSIQQPARQSVGKLFGVVNFTAREKEVLHLICKGLTTADIANQLFISNRTVEGHRQRLLEKTESPNIASLVVFAAKNGFLEV
ncbi:MAG: response regulator [Janthinobacterium lividum]